MRIIIHNPLGWTFSPLVMYHGLPWVCRAGRGPAMGQAGPFPRGPGDLFTMRLGLWDSTLSMDGP